MADYIPPTENLPIFDSSVFLTGDEFITQNQADKRYLRYPNAQGTENLQAINVNGNAQFNSTSNFKQNITIEGTADIIQQSGSQINQQPASNIFTFSGGNVLNPTLMASNSPQGVDPAMIICDCNTSNQLNYIMNASNNAYNPIVQAGDIVMSSTAPLVLTNGTGGNPTNGLRLDNTSITLGTGGSSDVPTNAIILNSSGATSFNSTTPPTSSQTIPAFTDSSNKIPTTAWVQGAIAKGSTAEYSYTTYGTYTLSVPTGYGHLKIICIGAGGGGGGGADMSNPSGGDKGATGGAGGGGGGVTIVDVELTTETSFTIVVGQGGNGGTNGGGYPNNGTAGSSGTVSYVLCVQNGLYYAYSTGGSGGGGALNQVAANSLTQPSGGAGGSGSQGVGGQGGKGVGLNNPSAYNTGFVFSGTVGSQSALIGAGGGGGGGAVYETPGSGGGNVYIDSDGQNGGALGFTLSQSILQGFGVGGKASGGSPAWQQPTSGSSVIRGVGGGGGGGGFASAFSGSSPPAAGGAAGGAGSGGGGGGSDHNYGSNGGRGGDGVVIMFFS